MPMTTTLKSDAVAFLGRLIKLSNSNIQYEFKVNSFLNMLSWELDLEHSLLLTIDSGDRILEPFHRSDSHIPKLSSIPLNDNIITRAITTRQSLLADESDIQTLSPDWVEFAIPYKNFFLAAPIADDKVTYGALLLFGLNPYEAHPTKTLIIESVCNELAIAIKNSIMTTSIKKRMSVLNVLNNLGRTLASTIDADRLMAMIPRIATGIFLAEGCTLNILDETGEKLILSSQYGLVPSSYNFENYIDAKTLPPNISQALQRKTSFSGFLKDDPCAISIPTTEKHHSIIASPLSFQGIHQGSITLFNKLGGSGGSTLLFSQDDLDMLLSMNSMISGVIENAIIFKEVDILAKTNQKMVAYLSSLYDISSAMMTTVRFDELIWIITKALTERKGLGFDQVLILLLSNHEDDPDDENPPVLKSVAFWSYDRERAYYEPDIPLVEKLKNISKEEAAQMLDKGQEMDISIPVVPGSSSTLARVLLEKKPMLGFRALDAGDDLHLKDFGPTAYAAVPMIAKNREVGIIAVDHAISSETLTLDSLRDLTMLANQAGLALENARLYDDIEKANQTLTQVRVQLIEAEKAAAQGEMGTQLAHEVRNPLVSIGGFTQRLVKKMSSEDPLRKYALVILEEVERLNKVLNNVLDFARDEKGLVRDFKMEDLVEETLHSLRHEIRRQKVTIQATVEPELPQVSADDRQVMHIILNLINNAAQAMGANGGDIYIRIFQTTENDQQYVACEITDTGPGIPDEMLPNIFSPFFTTKTQGTGLGLSIVGKIVNRYHGIIRLVNHPKHIKNSGASFIFMFPAAHPPGIAV